MGLVNELLTPSSTLGTDTALARVRQLYNSVILFGIFQEGQVLLPVQFAFAPVNDLYRIRTMDFS